MKAAAEARRCSGCRCCGGRRAAGRRRREGAAPGAAPGARARLRRRCRPAVRAGCRRPRRRRSDASRATGGMPMLLLVGLGNPGARTPATGTTSASWWSRRSPSATASGRGAGASRGLPAEGPIGGERVLLLLPGTYMNESGPRRRRGGAFLQARARRHHGLPRRDRSGAGQGAGKDRRRRRRPQRAAFDHRAYRQRLSAGAHRRRPSRRQGSGARARAQRFRQERARLGRGAHATCSPTMSACWCAARTRAFRTRCTSPWRRRVSGKPVLGTGRRRLASNQRGYKRTDRLPSALIWTFPPLQIVLSLSISI